MTTETAIDARPLPPLPTRASVTAAIFGNMIEFYDFTVYAFFAIYIGRAIFPAHDPFMGLLLSVATFGVGFFTRPLGAAFIGAYADRAGRKPAMMMTISLMAVGTLMMVLTPGYNSIGVAAPIIIVLARLVQGFALGGDVGPASAFLIESAPANRRGLVGSWQIASQGASTLLAGLVGVGLSTTLSSDAMQNWGWRVAFLIGLLIVPIGVIMRRAMPETLSTAGSGSTSLMTYQLFASHARTVFLGVLILMAGTITTYTSNYLTTYALTTLHLPASIALGATTVVGISTIAGALVGGVLSDHFGRKTVTVIPRLIVILIVYPAFLIMSWHPSAVVLYAMAAILTFSNALSVGVVFIAEALPAPVRGIGFAITYAIGISIFGGTTQFMLAWLIGTTGNPLSPAWYVATTSVVGLVAALFLSEVPPSTRRPILSL